MTTYKQKFRNIVLPLIILATMSSSLTGFASTISNTVNLSGTTPDPTSGNNTATVTDNLCYKADIAVVITSPTTVVANQSLAFTNTVTSAGPSTVTSVSVVFAYNSNQFTSPVLTTNLGVLGTPVYAGSGASSTITASITGLTLTTTTSPSLAIVATGTANPRFSGTTSPSVTVSPTAPTSGVGGCSMADTNTANNTSITGTGTIITASADMSITKNSSGGGTSANNLTNNNLVGSVNQNTNVTYTITATNNGPSTAAQPLTIVDTYNSNILQYVSITGSGWTCGSPNLTVPTAATISCTSATSILNGSNAQIIAVFKAL